MAIWTLKISEVEFDRISQPEFIIFSGQKEHSDEPIKLAMKFIEYNYENKLNLKTIVIINLGVITTGLLVNGLNTC